MKEVFAKWCRSPSIPRDSASAVTIRTPQYRGLKPHNHYKPPRLPGAVTIRTPQYRGLKLDNLTVSWEETPGVTIRTPQYRGLKLPVDTRYKRQILRHNKNASVKIPKKKEKDGITLSPYRSVNNGFFFVVERTDRCKLGLSPDRSHRATRLPSSHKYGWNHCRGVGKTTLQAV